MIIFLVKLKSSLTIIKTTFYCLLIIYTTKKVQRKASKLVKNVRNVIIIV